MPLLPRPAPTSSSSDVFGQQAQPATTHGAAEPPLCSCQPVKDSEFTVAPGLRSKGRAGPLPCFTGEPRLKTGGMERPDRCLVEEGGLGGMGEGGVRCCRRDVIVDLGRTAAAWAGHSHF